MSSNKYADHLLVLLEDDANRQIANGFILHHSLNQCAIQIESEAGGWGKVKESFQDTYLADLNKYPKRRVLLIVDMDGNVKNRLENVKSVIPADLRDRVFVVGVATEPERLRVALRCNFEEIGKRLANECADNTLETWRHDLLKHNEPELVRMIKHVKPFLFIS